MLEFEADLGVRSAEGRTVCPSLYFLCMLYHSSLYCISNSLRNLWYVIERVIWQLVSLVIQHFQLLTKHTLFFGEKNPEKII